MTFCAITKMAVMNIVSNFGWKEKFPIIVFYMGSFFPCRNECLCYDIVQKYRIILNMIDFIFLNTKSNLENICRIINAIFLCQIYIFI